MISQSLAELSCNLAQLAFKGTASIVHKKIETIKHEKDIEKLRATYESIINELIQEKEEAVRIAQAYKTEYERVVISDEDIGHLHATISRLLDVVKEISPEVNTDSFEIIEGLISADTLKTMQLLGFNYKTAIGEPLTKICSDAISSWGNSRQRKNRK